MTLHVTADADIATLFTEGDPDAAQQAAQFLKSIAHRDRLKILCALLDKEHPVSEIEEKVGATWQTPKLTLQMTLATKCFAIATGSE